MTYDPMRKRNLTLVGLPRLTDPLTTRTPRPGEPVYIPVARRLTPQEVEVRRALLAHWDKRRAPPPPAPEPVCVHWGVVVMLCMVTFALTLALL